MGSRRSEFYKKNETSIFVISIEYAQILGWFFATGVSFFLGWHLAEAATIRTELGTGSRKLNR